MLHTHQAAITSQMQMSHAKHGTQKLLALHDITVNYFWDLVVCVCMYVSVLVVEERTELSVTSKVECTHTYGTNIERLRVIGFVAAVRPDHTRP